MPRFMSEEWIQLYKDAVNNNKAYAQAASWWTGDFIFIARAIGNFENDTIIFIGLNHGKCTGVKSISSEDEYEVVMES